MYVTLLVTVTAQPNSPHRYHRGWLAPEIYCIGHVDCTPAEDVCISGSPHTVKSSRLLQSASHIYPQPGFTYERLSYSSSTARSIYHVFQYNIQQLNLLSHPEPSARTTGTSPSNSAGAFFDFRVRNALPYRYRPWPAREPGNNESPLAAAPHSTVGGAPAGDFQGAHGTQTARESTRAR